MPSFHLASTIASLVLGGVAAQCVDKACTTHCNISDADACCKPLTCMYDPVFSDTRCIPPQPLICDPEPEPAPTHNANCVDKACTTHCNVSAVGSCCAPLTCMYDPVFSDTRCIPPQPLICEEAIPTTMSGYAANSMLGASSAKFSASLGVPAVGSLHETFQDIPNNYSSCEVLVKVMASSVNPSDVGPSVGRNGKTEVVMGSDMAGVVVQADASKCKRLKVGSAVWGDIGANAHLSQTGRKTKELGAYGEYAIALESQLGLKPDRLTFVEAGALPKVSLTSYKALVWYAGAPWNNSDVTVLVLGGSGGCGTTGVQLARHFGAKTIVSTCGKDNFDYCRANGADQLIDYHTQNWWDVVPDDSVDVIYDTVGQQGTADYAMKKIKTGGHFVTIAGSLSRNPKAGVTQSFFINSDTNLANLAEMDALTEIANLGALRMPRIYASYSLQEVGEGFKTSETGKVVGKVSIVVSNSSSSSSSSTATTSNSK